MKKQYVIIAFIFILSIVIRFWQLDKIPQGFHADEAAYGYNAYSLLKTGKDEYGQTFPLILRSFDDYKGAIYSYLTIPFIAIFGLNEFAVRFPSALFGILLVLLTYFVIQRLSKNNNLALLTSILVSISPISILLSRVQSDPLVSVFFVLLGFYFFLYWLEKKRVIYLLLYSFFWILSFFTYASSKAFLPPFMLILLLFYFKHITNTQKKLMLFSFISIILINVYLIFGYGGARFSQVNIFNTSEVTLPLEEKIREDGINSAISARFFHNKIYDYGQYLINNYFQYLSFSFLFYQGGEPAREKIPNTGILYLIQLPFLLFGIYKIFRQKIKWGYLVLSWIFLVPVVLSFASDETPNVHRFYLAILPIELVSAFGISEFINIIKERKKTYSFSVAIICLIFLYSLIYFMHQLFVHQPLHRPWYRGYAYKELVMTLNEYYPNYKKIIFTKAHASPYIYLLFYNKYDPIKYQVLGSPRDFDNSGFDKYYFMHIGCPLDEEGLKEGSIEGEENVLYVEHGSCSIPKQNGKLIKTINWGDGSAAFKLVEYVSTQSSQLEKSL